MNINFDQLQNQLTDVKASIKSGGISVALQNQLVANEMLLQGWINKMITGGTLTQEELSQMESALDSSKKQMLEAQSERTKRTIAFVGIGVLVIVGGIIFYYFKKKHK